MELNLRSLKELIGLDVLRCQSAEMVRKEFETRLLAWNLVRGVMARAARKSGKDPRRLSTKGAMQMISEFGAQMAGASKVVVARLRKELLERIASLEVGNRPDRVEPRVVKRRPKAFPLMTRPRAQYRRTTQPKT